MANDPHFNWRDYLRIDDSFPLEQRAVVEQALNDIARFRDGEGQTLIRRAYEVRREAVVIVPHAGSFFVQNAPPFIQLDFAASKSISWAGMGTPIPGIVPVLVHELYHAADSTRDINEQARHALFGLLGLRPDDPRAARLRAVLIERRPTPYYENDAGQINEWLLKDGHGRLEEVLRQERMPELAAVAATTDQTRRVAVLAQAGVIVTDYTRAAQEGIARAHLRTEQDATSYADALLLRNYGPAYTPRRTYGNTQTPALAPPSVGATPATPYMPLTGEDYPTPGFAAEPSAVGDLGQLPPPTVAAHTLPVIRTAQRGQ